VLVEDALEKRHELRIVFDHEDRGLVGGCMHLRLKILCALGASRLEVGRPRRLLWDVAFTRLRAASATIFVGSIAAAATTGALLAIGHRMGGASLPFAATGATLLRQTVSGASAGLVLAGFALHVALVFAWSALCVWLVRAHGWRPMLAAFAVALAAHVASWLAAWSTGYGVASVVALGDRIVLAAVFALALVAGIRLALFAPRST
jgi:hypothetical protein